MSQTSPRLVGRTIALLLLLLILCGVFAQGLVANRLIVAADAGATARNILAHVGLYRLSFTVFLIEMVANVANTALFYILLRPVNRSIALTATFIDLAAGVMKTFARVFYILPLWVLTTTAGGASTVLQGFTPQQVESISLILLQINNRGAATASAFFGFSITMRGYLMFRSTFMPRWLGVLTMISGVGWLAFLYPPLVSFVFLPVVLLTLVSSAVLIVWLLFFGVREEEWHECAMRTAA
ncbi:MAG TPA: DUF4386 domain-containing protein [Pyrinomonadaceae bacterium]|jgi:hypothetical protein|nr:DUF4386 domain-containing protein [Pyrinomonadaceae bacterium]